MKEEAEGGILDSRKYIKGGDLFYEERERGGRVGKLRAGERERERKRVALEEEKDRGEGKGR